MDITVNKIYRYIVFVIISGLVMSACSTKKNTSLSRNYHNLTSHYNIYFNAYETYREGFKKVELSYQDDFNQLIPINIYSREEVARRLMSDMEKSKKKCSKLITKHSITARPKNKRGPKSDRQKAFYKKNEYNKWVDDSYFLMGKTFYFQHDFFPAIKNFEYVLREYPEEGLKEEATLWLAKTHLELQDYNQAKEILDRLEAERELSDRFKAELYAVMADWYFRQEMFSDALGFLSQAAEMTSSKKDRMRYYYILGQLFEIEEDYTQASMKYEEVIKLKPGYKMAFNAKINRARLYQGGGEEGKDIRRQLEKMLRDDKNLDYLDQIYYALAEIDMKEGNVDAAIENYKLSAFNSYVNNHQKSLSFLALGKIYYDKPEYIKSSAFYDSCTMLMPDDFPDYDEVQNHAYGLSLLADNLKVIETEDSLLLMADLPEAELNAIIAEKIKEAQEIEDELKRIEEEEQFNQRSTYRRYGQGGNLGRNPAMNTRMGQPGQGNMGQGGSMPGGVAGGGSTQWYFYNPTTLSFGESEFIKLYGRRKLEDNWRRSNKNISSAASDISTEGEEGDIQSVATESKSMGFKPTTREYYVADLPITDSAKLMSNKRIEIALFNVGKIFADELNKPEESKEYFLMLNNRYPETEKLLFSYYNLYQLYKEEPNPQEEVVYKNLILRDFPDSRSAKIINNPNYFEEIEEARQEVKAFYVETYSAYLNQQYDQVLANCLLADTGFLLNPIRDKFGLLEVMAHAKLQPENTEFLKDELNSLVFKFPESEVAEPARNLINYLENGPSDSEKPGKKPGLLIGAIADNPDDGEEANYTLSEKSVHYYVVILSSTSGDVNRLKYNISSYNVENYDQDFFEVKSEVLMENLLIISVRDFKDSKSGMDYYKGILVDPVVFGEYSETDFRHFVISKANYSIFFNNKNVFNYIRFFNENYLNQDN